MFFLIDTFSLLYRLFFALPELTINEISINAIYGLVRLTIKLTKEYKIKNLVFCVDKGKSGRTEVYRNYKAHRKPVTDKFKQQIPVFYEFCNSAGFYVYGIEGLEADDTIFTLANYLKNFNTTVVVLTGDKDMLQIIDKNISVLMLKKGISEVEFFDQNKFQKEFGFDSKFFVYYKALVGDASDNIKGVKGIGPKKATDIIKKSNLNDIENEILALLDQENAEIFLNNLKLISLKNYMDKVNIDLEKTKVDLNWYKRDSFKDFLKKYNFVSILKEVEDRQLKLF